MKLFIFASVRGADFQSFGKDVHEAYKNLVEKEKHNGSLWKLQDKIRNQWCFDNGWRNLNGIAYKEIKTNKGLKNEHCTI